MTTVSRGWHVDHACGATALIWDVACDGLVLLQCSCNASPADLAKDLGLALEQLHPMDIALSLRMLPECA